MADRIEGPIVEGLKQALKHATCDHKWVEVETPSIAPDGHRGRRRHCTRCKMTETIFDPIK